jgi:PEP-CTERM motif
MKKILSASIATVCAVLLATSAWALSITQTTNGTTLGTALGGAGLTINSVTTNNGAASQFGTYTGFTSPPVTFGDGVVLSTGLAVQGTAAFHSNGSSPSTDTGAAGTAAFDAYGPGHITNFNSSHNVAALQVNFTLASASQVGFDFVFGSVEFPVFTNNFTDAFVAFLDGTATANQIVFDASLNAVQVGSTFASVLTTADTNTAFSNPHGLVKLTTFSSSLGAGAHSIIFEVGDVNDGELDSAVFLNNFHAGSGETGTTPVPEPASLTMFGLGIAGLAAVQRLRGRRARRQS